MQRALQATRQLQPPARRDLDAEVPLKVDPALADLSAVSLENAELYSWDLAGLDPDRFTEDRPRYQRFLSPLLGANCRFEPSCSRYAQQAIERHGALKGTLLGAWRILRCNPLSKGGQIDPIPPVGKWRPSNELEPRPGTKKARPNGRAFRRLKRNGWALS